MKITKSEFGTTKTVPLLIYFIWKIQAALMLRSLTLAAASQKLLFRTAMVIR